MQSHRVLIALFDGVQSLDITGPMEVFTGADQYARAHQPGAPGYRIGTAALGGGPVRTSSGLRIIPDADLAAEHVPHTLIVPGGDGTREPRPALIRWLRAHAHRAHRLVSVCTGAFLLAEAGLLAGRRATTHWSQCDSLADRFPDIRVQRTPIFVRDGRVATSAGVTAGIDLALALVEEDLGREAALTVARHLVVFLRRPGGQAQFSAQLRAQSARREPLRALQGWIADNPGANLSVEALAGRVGLSPRQFARVFTAEVGVTPGRYVDRVRLESARRLLEESDDGVVRVARRCGYGTPEAMRRAFLRTLGVSPAEYRRRFRPLIMEGTSHADRHPAL